MVEFPKMINGLNIKERNISKYLTLAKNIMPSYIRCRNMTYGGNEVCIETNFIIKSFSNIGECYTLSPLRYQLSEQSKFDLDKIIFSNNVWDYRRKSFDLNSQFFTHYSNQLPSLTFTDSVVDDYSVIKIKRLPPPYDSNCFDYQKSNSFKSRGQCINDCIFKKILKKYNCIPRESISVLTLYDNTTLDSTFCEDKKFEGFSEDDCSERCLKPCEESFHSTLDRRTNYEIKHIIYMHNIYMTFIYFMSSIGGLLGLWNNVCL
jgi:hypothetical protein